MDATPPGRLLRATFLHKKGIEAFVDASPGLIAHAQASHAQLIHLQADRFVVTTPSAALASTQCNNAARPVVRTQHGSNLVTLSPRPHSQCSHREKAGLSGYETAARMRTVARTGHDIASRVGCRALALTQVPQAQQEYSAFSIHTLASMTERPLTVTQHLQALHDMATSSGMEGMDDKAASLFASLDRVWIETHREKADLSSIRRKPQDLHADSRGHSALLTRGSAHCSPSQGHDKTAPPSTCGARIRSWPRPREGRAGRHFCASHFQRAPGEAWGDSLSSSEANSQTDLFRLDGGEQ